MALRWRRPAGKGGQGSVPGPKNSIIPTTPVVNYCLSLFCKYAELLDFYGMLLGSSTELSTAAGSQHPCCSGAIAGCACCFRATTTRCFRAAAAPDPLRLSSKSPFFLGQVGQSSKSSGDLPWAAYRSRVHPRPIHSRRLRGPWCDLGPMLVTQPAQTHPCGARSTARRRGARSTARRGARSCPKIRTSGG